MTEPAVSHLTLDRAAAGLRAIALFMLSPLLLLTVAMVKNAVVSVRYRSQLDVGGGLDCGVVIMLLAGCCFLLAYGGVREGREVAAVLSFAGVSMLALFAAFIVVLDGYELAHDAFRPEVTLIDPVKTLLTYAAIVVVLLALLINAAQLWRAANVARQLKQRGFVVDPPTRPAPSMENSVEPGATS